MLKPTGASPTMACTLDTRWEYRPAESRNMRLDLPRCCRPRMAARARAPLCMKGLKGTGWGPGLSTSSRHVLALALALTLAQALVGLGPAPTAGEDDAVAELRA